MKNEKDSENTNDSPNENGASRRDFLRKGLITGSVLAAGGIGLNKLLAQEEKKATCGARTTVLTPDGKVYSADPAHLHKHSAPPVSNLEARKGIAGKKFVMVFDLAGCDGCKACTEACQAMHFTDPDREWLKVYKMKDSKTTAPYYFPKPCFQCDNSPCVKVCPVDATFKRQDGIILVDNERCIGCRSCMVACPYSTRFFNWGQPKQAPEATNMPYSPEYGYPSRVGTVEKCDFCPHMIREGKLPACVTACGKDVIWFGDQNEDAVTNGSGVTVRFSQLLKDNAGYRYMEDLGTEPRVYYLPPKNRKFPEPEMPKKDDTKKKEKQDEHNH